MVARIRSSVGFMAGLAARLCCSLASSTDVVQFLARVFFIANVRPVVVRQGGRWPSRLLDPLRGIRVE